MDFGRFGRLAASTVELLWRCARLAQSARCGCRCEHSCALDEIPACSAHDSCSFTDSAGLHSETVTGIVRQKCFAHSLEFMSGDTSRLLIVVNESNRLVSSTIPSG